MKVYLLRHAQAEPGFPDAERKLTEKGCRDVEKLGALLRGKDDFRPEHTWVSPLLRAEETASVFLQALGMAHASVLQKEEASLEPDRDPLPLVDLLSALEEDVLLVGHNPNLEILSSLLISGERYRSRIYLKTCSLVCLEWLPQPDHGQSGICALRWVLDPRLI
tara:strand:+ start:31159 stop:31650 length:492 start_codon:yes stop_codon:yes gene_type:complete